MSNDTPIQKAARFQVFVPSPSTRFNLGKADDAREVGFPGASLITDAHLFLSVKKQTQLHSTGAVRLQSGAGWDQYTTGNMTVAATGNATIGVENRMVLAAGEGVGKGFTFSPHYDPENPSWRAYNRLRFHHQVDQLTKRLKKLFYGNDWQKWQVEAKDVQEGWFPQGNRSGDGPVDGMVYEAYRLLVRSPLDFDSSKFLIESMGWQPHHVGVHSIHHAIRKGWKTSEFPHTRLVDPYATTAVVGTGVGKLLNEKLAYLEQFGLYLQRTADALELFLVAIEGLEFVARIRDTIGALNDLHKVLRANTADASKEWTEVAGAFAAFKSKSVQLDDSLNWASGAAESAKLTTVAGPFELVAESDFALEVFTDNGATAGTVIDFSDVLAPAEATFTISDKHTRLGVGEPSQDATMEVDGELATYAAAGAGWSLPAGFSIDGGTLSKGGAPFSLGASVGVMVWDTSFHGEKATLLVDGQAVPLELTSVSGMPGEARANALAKLVDGKLGARATATGASVTITGQRRGAGGSVVLVGSAACKALGVNAREAVAGATVDVETMRARLQAAFGGAATVKKVPENGSPQALTIETTTKGKSAYLKATGGLAMSVFGAAMAESEGKDKVDGSKALIGWTDALTAFLELGKWSDASHLGPVVQSVRKLAGVWGQIEKSLKKLQKGLFGGPKPVPSIGLFAGLGGISLATHGDISQAGHSISLIAAGRAEKHWIQKKVVEGELLTNFALKLQSEWEEAFRRHDMQRKERPENGDLRLLSSGQVGMVAREHVQMMAVSGDVRAVAAHQIHLSARGTATLQSDASLSLKGHTIAVGELPPPTPGASPSAKIFHPYYPATRGRTNAVTVNATRSVSLHAGSDSMSPGPSLTLSGGDRTLRLGSRVTNPPKDDAALSIDLVKSTATLGTTQTSVGVDGDNGVTTVMGEKDVVVGVGGTALMGMTNNKVTFAGDVDVGGVLTVKGASGKKVPVAQTLENVKTVFDRQAAVFNNVMAKFHALVAKVESLDQILGHLAERRVGFPGGGDVAEAAVAALANAEHMVLVQRQEAVLMLEDLRAEALALQPELPSWREDGGAQVEEFFGDDRDGGEKHAEPRAWRRWDEE